MENDRWSIDHPFLYVTGFSLALTAPWVFYGEWRRALLLSLGMAVLTSIEVVRDRAAFRRGGPEELQTRRRRRLVMAVTTLAVLTLVLVVTPALA